MTTSLNHDSELGPKQEAFVNQFVIDLNGTQAAIRAGYSPATAAQQAGRLLTKVKIKQRIQRVMDERSKRTNITADRVLQELARIAFSDVRKVAKWGHWGVAATESDELDDDAAAAIASISQSANAHGVDIKIKLVDKVAALDRLGRHLKMFTDKVEHEIGPNLADIVDAASKIR